jgi:hypothetical protein
MNQPTTPPSLHPLACPARAAFVPQTSGPGLLHFLLTALFAIVGGGSVVTLRITPFTPSTISHPLPLPPTVPHRPPRPHAQCPDPFSILALKAACELLTSHGGVLVLTGNRALADLPRHGLHEAMFDHWVATLRGSCEELELSARQVRMEI